MLTLTIVDWFNRNYKTSKVDGLNLEHSPYWSNVKLTGAYKWETHHNPNTLHTAHELWIQFYYTKSEWSWRKFRFVDNGYTSYISEHWMGFEFEETTEEFVCDCSEEDIVDRILKMPPIVTDLTDDELPLLAPIRPPQ